MQTKIMLRLIDLINNINQMALCIRLQDANGSRDLCDKIIDIMIDVYSLVDKWSGSYIYEEDVKRLDSE